MTPGERPLVIVGAGDHGRVVLELARAAGRHIAGFVEPSTATPREAVDGVPLLGSLAQFVAEGEDHDCVVALGDNAARKAAAEAILGAHRRLPPLVHPTATLLSGAVIGHGAQICARSVIGVAARIGVNAIVNTSASIDHDCDVGSHAFIGPGAILAGRVSVGEGAFVGAGAVVLPGVTIGAWSLVAAGAVVVGDVEARARVGGIPARGL